MRRTKLIGRGRRHRRVRKKIRGTATRPRLSVYRSNRHVYAQLIDDVDGRTLAAASTMEPSLRDKSSGTVEAASKVGTLIGERGRDAGVTAVVFDRGGFKYHGRVAGVAEAARDAGLEF